MNAADTSWVLVATALVLFFAATAFSAAATFMDLLFCAMGRFLWGAFWGLCLRVMCRGGGSRPGFPYVLPGSGCLKGGKGKARNFI